MRARSARRTSPNGYLPLIALSSKWEQAFAEAIVGQGEERSFAMAPSRLSEFITLVPERFEDAAREGEAPVLVTSPGCDSLSARSWSDSAPGRRSCRRQKSIRGRG